MYYTLNHDKKRFIAAVMLLVSCVFMLTFCVTPSFANGSLSFDNTFGPISLTFATGLWKSNISGIARLLQKVALFGGAIGVSWCGVEYVSGDSQKASKAISKAIIIAGAVVATYALPYFIKMGINLGKSIAWDPSKLK